MIYTEAQITSIHLNHNGVEGRLYFTVTSKVYKGLKTGSLLIDPILTEALQYFVTTGLSDRYKVFTYDIDNNLTRKKVYTDSTMSTEILTSEFNYTGDNLTSIDITRHSDGATFTKTLTYDIDNNLTTVELI